MGRANQKGMSWDAYVSDQIIGSGSADFGCILSKEDGSVWAASGDAVCGAEGQATLAKWAASANPESPQANGTTGVTLNEKKFMVLNGDVDDDIPTLCMKGGKDSAFACVTEQCIIVGIAGEKIQGGACRTAVFNLAKYLKDNSY